MARMRNPRTRHELLLKLLIWTFKLIMKNLVKMPREALTPIVVFVFVLVVLPALQSLLGG